MISLLLAASVTAATFTLTTTGAATFGLPCAKIQEKAGVRVWYRAEASVLAEGEELGLRLDPPSGSLCVASPAVVLMSRTGSGTTLCAPDPKCPGEWTMRIEKWKAGNPANATQLVEATVRKP